MKLLLLLPGERPPLEHSTAMVNELISHSNRQACEAPGSVLHVPHDLSYSAVMGTTRVKPLLVLPGEGPPLGHSTAMVNGPIFHTAPPLPIPPFQRPPPPPKSAPPLPE